MRNSTVLLAHASILAVMLGATPALAQSGPVSGPPEAVVPEPPEEDQEECDPAAPRGSATACDNPDRAPRNADGSSTQDGRSVTVTGTRIRLPNLESLEPTVTLDSRQVRERNFTNVADALNELPGFRGSVTPAGSQGSFGQGVNFVNNYGLGSNRTLTLINGRRFVTSNPSTNFGNAASGTQVDLNIVPAILLDRIDTVSIGGAPIYGSDAISGTVNVILRSKFEGIEVTGLTGITEQGDNFRYNASGLIGRTFGDRLNVTLAVSRDEVSGVLFSDREFLRRGIGGITNVSEAQANASRFPGVTDFRLNRNIGFNNTTTDFNPGVVVARGVGIPFLSSGGLITSTNLAATNPNNPASLVGRASNNALLFDNNGNLIPLNQGVLNGTTVQASGLNSSGSDVFLFNDFSQITSELNRTIFNGFVTFEVTPNIDIFLEGTHFRSRADELVQQPTFNSSLFGGNSSALAFRVDSPFLTDQARAALVARGVTSFSISRASTDLADPTGFNTTRINRGVAGVRGDFQLFNRNMNFEAYANIGETRGRDARQDLNAQNFVNAVNVTRNAQGQIVCTTTPTQQALPGSPLRPVADPNCVPFNPLGAGVASQAARDYIIEDTDARSRQQQRVYNINVGGSVFDIWGGAVGFNVGYEHRDEEAEFTPDEFAQQGRGRSVPITALEGKFNLDEVFGEVLLPLVSPETGLSFLQSATAFARGRYVQSTVNGGFFSYAVGGTMAPIEDIEFRGNFTRSFRSPAITELFLPRGTAFSTVPDICSAGSRNAGPDPATRARNCAAFLAAFPGSTPDPAASATVQIFTGGNPDLENEQADSYTIGFIARPSFLPRFSMTADYISITLNQPIASLGVAAIASACFDNPQFNLSDPANGNSFCSLILRDPTTGRVVNDPARPAVTTGFVNGQEIKFRGIQGTMNYSLPLTGLGLGGTLNLGGDMLYVRKRINNITGVAPSRSDGTIGDPEFAGQARVRYTQDQFGINVTAIYTGEQLFSRLNRAVGVAGSGPDAREFDQLNDFVTFSGGMFFDATEDFRLTLSVTNIFNRQGARVFGELLPASFNDLLGRRFAASARVRF